MGDILHDRCFHYTFQSVVASFVRTKKGRFVTHLKIDNAELEIPWVTMQLLCALQSI